MASLCAGVLAVHAMTVESAMAVDAGTIVHRFALRVSAETPLVEARGSSTLELPLGMLDNLALLLLACQVRSQGRMKA